LSITACGRTSAEAHVCNKTEAIVRDSIVRSEVYAADPMGLRTGYEGAASQVSIYAGEVSANSKIGRAASRLRDAYAEASRPGASPSTANVARAEVNFRSACGLPLNP
jgi:hypothetical protein